MGFAAKRRLPETQRLSCDCALGEEALNRLIRPQVVEGQRVAGLRLDDPRALVLFTLLLQSFANKGLRERLARLLGGDRSALPAVRRTYDVHWVLACGCRLHGLIARIPGTHRYRPTHEGLRPGLAQILPPADSPHRAALERASDRFLERAFAAA